MNGKSNVRYAVNYLTRTRASILKKGGKYLPDHIRWVGLIFATADDALLALQEVLVRDCCAHRATIDGEMMVDGRWVLAQCNIKGDVIRVLARGHGGSPLMISPGYQALLSHYERVLLKRRKPLIEMWRKRRRVEPLDGLQYTPITENEF